MLAGGEHRDVLAADDGGALAVVGRDRGGDYALGLAVLVGAEVPGAFQEHGVLAVDAVPGVDGAVHVADGEDARVVQLGYLLHGGDALGAVEIARGLGEVVVRQHAAEEPEVGVHIPVSHAGDVYRIGAPSGSRLDELLHRLGHGVKAELGEDVHVHDRGFAVGVEGQAVVLALIEVRGERSIHVVGGDLRKVGVVREGHKSALGSVGGDVRNIHTGDIRACAGAEGGDDHLMVLAAVLAHGLDRDLGVQLVPEREHHVEQLRLLAVAVSVPEGDGDGFRRGLGSVGCRGIGLGRRRGLLRRLAAAGEAAEHQHRRKQQGKGLECVLFHFSNLHVE